MAGLILAFIAVWGRTYKAGNEGTTKAAVDVDWGASAGVISAGLMGGEASLGPVAVACVVALTVISKDTAHVHFMTRCGTEMVAYDIGSRRRRWVVYELRLDDATVCPACLDPADDDLVVLLLLIVLIGQSDSTSSSVVVSVAALFILDRTGEPHV